jgi:hypothetical protein
LVVLGELTNEMAIYPAELEQLKCYLLRTDNQEPQIELHLMDRTMQYGGNIKASSLKKWVMAQAQSLLSNLLQ